jgi:hypothetical protein
MKFGFALLCALALTLAGCSTNRRQGVSHLDPFDAVQVDQMLANSISGRVLQKSVLCLNARRETLAGPALTNTSVITFTNITVTPVTNVTVSMATNFLASVMTNLAPPILLAPPPETTSAAATEPGTPATPDTTAAATATASPPQTQPLPLTNAPPSVSSNISLSFAANVSAISGPNFAGSNHQLVHTSNHQLTTVSNNLSITLATNVIVTVETNLVVNWITNVSVSTLTNISVTPEQPRVSDYFLVAELIAPPDFTLASGESLVLLVDGVRHSFPQSQSNTAFVGRRGYATTLYRVRPELLTAMADADSVLVRLKGVNSVIERTMNASSRENLRAFVQKFILDHTAAASGTARAHGGVDALASTARP